MNTALSSVQRVFSKTTFVCALAAAALALPACGNSKNDTSNDPKPFAGNPPSQEKTVDVTPKGQCRYGTPARQLDGRWQFDLQQGEINFHMVFNFHNGYVTLTNNCEVRGHTLAVTVGAPYMEQGNQVTVMGEANDTERTSEGGMDMSCSAAIKRGRMSYAFNGSCLDMHAENSSETLTLIPATY